MVKMFFLSFLVVVICNYQSEAVEEYFGKEIGPLSTLHHGVKGTIYVIDSKRLGVRGFYYDGTAPAAFFWIGLKGKHGEKPDKTGIAVPDEHGRRIVLKKYEAADFVLTLPRNITTDQLRWFSVWCHEFLIDFGNVIFPEDLSVPTPADVGRFSQLGHGVSSGDVTITDHKTGLIRNFVYDGQGNDVFFVAGNGSTTTDSKLLIKLSRVIGGLEELPSFSGSDVIVRFPGPTNVFMFRFLALYSNSTGETYGQVNLPLTPINVPPFTLDPVVKLT